MPSHRPRPRRKSPPPLAGGGEAPPKAAFRGRGILRSRQLRAQSSDAETRLWESLRRKQVNGLRFRRQFPLGSYFGDFVCLPARLVVEVDGSQHGEAVQILHDTRRTEFLEREGFRVIRFSASDVMVNLAAVLDGIEAALRLPLPHGASRSAPSRKGRGK